MCGQGTRILKTLIRYVKALQKDRIHIMNRYRHQLQTSPSDAEANRPQMVDHLANCDRQLKAAIYMLDRLDRYKDKIVKQIGLLPLLSSTTITPTFSGVAGCLEVGAIEKGSAKWQPAPPHQLRICGAP